MSDQKKDEDSDGTLYRMDTVPPPAGEDDAYSAPTKVGPMADVAVQELMKAAERRAVELSRRSAEKIKNANAAASAAATTKAPAFVLDAFTPKPARRPEDVPGASAKPPPAEAKQSTSIPIPPPPEKPKTPSSPPRVVYEEDDDDEDVATHLHPSAKPPVFPSPYVEDARPPAPIDVQLHTQPIPNALLDVVRSTPPRVPLDGAPAPVSPRPSARPAVEPTLPAKPSNASFIVPLVFGLVLLAIGIAMFWYRHR